MQLFILDDYHDCKKLFFSTILTKVSNGLYGIDNIGSFPSPTIAKAAFLLLVSTYRSANLDYEAGGVDEKPAYETALSAVIEALDSGKAYVGGLPGLTVNLINLSGFTPNKQSVSSSKVPDQPIFHSITRVAGGTNIFDFYPVDGAEFYGAYLIPGSALPNGSTFTDGILFIPGGMIAGLVHHALKQRIKTFKNLTIGQQYTIFYYAGNSAGVSLLSVGTTFTPSVN
jgi:hypothetical protein